MQNREQEKRESEPKSIPLKFYIAGSFSERQEIRGLMDRIEEMGYEIITDWTTHLPIKPYEDNLELANQYADEDIRGAADCDIFILKPAKEGGGTQFAELGAAIDSEKVKRIFVVGPHNKRSVVFFHSRIERVDSPEEIFMKLFPHG